jgi:hypothetical protein
VQRIGFVLLAAFEADEGLAKGALFGMIVAEVSRAVRALPGCFMGTT